MAACVDNKDTMEGDSDVDSRDAQQQQYSTRRLSVDTSKVTADAGAATNATGSPAATSAASQLSTASATPRQPLPSPKRYDKEFECEHCGATFDTSRNRQQHAFFCAPRSASNSPQHTILQQLSPSSTRQQHSPHTRSSSNRSPMGPPPLPRRGTPKAKSQVTDEIKRLLSLSTLSRSLPRATTADVAKVVVDSRRSDVGGVARGRGSGPGSSSRTGSWAEPPMTKAATPTSAVRRPRATSAASASAAVEGEGGGESLSFRVDDITVVYKSARLGVRFTNFSATADDLGIIRQSSPADQSNHKTSGGGGSSSRRQDGPDTATRRANDNDHHDHDHHDHGMGHEMIRCSVDFSCVQSLAPQHGGDMRTMLRRGDILYAINGTVVIGMSFDQLSQYLAKLPRPVSMLFKRHTMLAELLKSPDFNRKLNPNIGPPPLLSSVSQDRVRWVRPINKNQKIKKSQKSQKSPSATDNQSSKQAHTCVFCLLSIHLLQTSMRCGGGL